MKSILFFLLFCFTFLSAQYERGNTGYDRDKVWKAVFGVPGAQDTVEKRGLWKIVEGSFAFDTTELKQNKSGIYCYLAGLSSTNRNGSGWFVEIDSAYEEGVVAFDHPISGKQWVRINWIKENVVYVDWSGAIDDNSTDNYTAIKKALSVSEVKRVHFPKLNSGIYKTNYGFTINKSEFVISGDMGVQIKLTENDTLFYVTSNASFKIENLRLVGPGRNTPTVGLYTYTPTGGGRHYIENVWIEYFGEGYKNHEITQVVSVNMQIWHCGTGMAIGRQGDVHTHINYRAAYCDTGLVVGWDRNTLGNSPIVFVNAFFIKDSMNVIVHDRNHLIKFDGYYSEDARQEGKIEAVSGNNIIILNGLYTQGSISGWDVDGGYFSITNSQGNVSSINYVVQNSGVFHSKNNMLTGNGSIKYGSLVFNINNDVSIGDKNHKVIDLNPSTYSTNYPYTVEGYNGNGKLLQRWSRITSSGISLWDVFIKDAGTGASNQALLGISGGFFQLGNNGTTNPPNPASDNRGWFFNKDGTEEVPDGPDSIMVSIYDGSNYKWYEILRGVYRGNGPTAGIETFGASYTSDTVIVKGIDNNSIFVITPISSSPDPNTMFLSYTVTDDTLFVHRPNTTAGALKYSWIRKEIK